MTNFGTHVNPLKFLPVILICLGLIAFGMYKTFHRVFDMRQAAVTGYYNADYQKPTDVTAATPSGKIIPTVTNGGGKIQLALLNTKCEIEIETDKKNYSVTTEGLLGTCKNEPFGKISPSEDVLAFTGTLGRTVSLIKIFIPAYERTVTIGSWKDGEIGDYIFLPDNTLVVLVLYQNQLTVEAYDISLIKQDLPEILNESTGYVLAGKRHGSKILEIEGGKSLNYKNGQIQVLSKEKNILVKTDVRSIYLESKLTTISPEKAIQMAVNYYIQTENGPGIKGQFNFDESTDNEWAINIVTAEGKIVKKYMVNNKTGEIK